MNLFKHWGTRQDAGTAVASGDRLYKTQHEDVHGNWSDVSSEAGELLTFGSLDEARAGAAAEFPLDTHLAKYGGRQRTRVVRVYRSDAEWRENS